MTPVASVLFAVATELSELAKSNMPMLRKGETVQHEWFEDASFYRETSLNGQRFIAQFNFRRKKGYRVVVKGGNVND